MSVLKYLNDTQTARLWAKIKAGFVAKSGDTMTGALTLAGDPVSDLQAATKKYVDDNAGGSEDIFIAEYGVTSASDIVSAREGGKVVYVTNSAGYTSLVTDVTTDSTDYIIKCVHSDGRSTLYINKSTGSWTGGPYYEFAKLSSPSFTGTPTAPTAAAGTDTTQIATTAFVQDALESVDALPSQTGQSGKFLTTDGTDASWGTVDALPSQSGKNGKYLKTNGTAASWEDGPAQTAKIWTGYCTTAADVVPKVVVLDNPTGFSLDQDNRIAVRFYNGIEIPSTVNPALNVNNTGNKHLNIPIGINTFADERSKLICARGETCFFSYNPYSLNQNGAWVLETSGLLLSKAYDTADAALPKAGGTMTGSLTLSGAPTSDLHAATKGYVDEAIGSVTGVSFEIVQSLPQTGDAGTIYLVPNSGSSPNIYDEYIYVATAWEKIGTTEIDLSGYVPTSRKVNNKALSADISLTASDVGALPSTTSIPSKTSDLTNDSGFITGYTETDPTVPSWAKASSKPSYTAAEVGAQTKITASGLLKGDGSGNITAAVAGTDYLASFTETDPTVPSWAKQSSKPSYTASEVGAVPTTRTVNGKALSSDITLSASDVSALPSSTTIPTASTTNPSMDGTASYGSGTVYARSNHVHPTDTSRQAKITASGLLKGDGSGGVSAATAGTDYLTLATLPIYDGTVV